MGRKHLTEADKTNILAIYFKGSNPHHYVETKRLREVAALFYQRYGFEVSLYQIKHVIDTAPFDPKIGENRGGHNLIRPAIHANIEEALATGSRSQISTRALASSNWVSHMTVHRALRKDLQLVPYKIRRIFRLTDTHKAGRVSACEHFVHMNEIYPDFWNHVWYSDEAHFDLNHTINKQNDRIWAASQPENFVIEQVSYPKRVTVLGAIHASKGIIYTFIDGTITADAYVKALEDEIIPKMRARMTSDSDWDVFQQDGAAAHTAGAAISFLEDNFAFIISKNSSDPDLQWPASSPDLNPMDAFCWGYLKSKVSLRSHEINNSINFLKEVINDEIHDLDLNHREKITNACNAFQNNVQKCLNKLGGHITAGQ